MLKFGLVADDFTGACDVGAQFRKFGLETVILINPESLKTLHRFFDVAVVDTESRNVPPEEAYHKVREAVRALREWNVKLIYKKVDSTLRGNLGAEIDAVIDELSLGAVIFSPSFPANGRTTMNGRLYVDGVPLEETEYARDPLNPVETSYIPALIRRQTVREVSLITLKTLRAGFEALRGRIDQLRKDGSQIIVVDAETRDDLKTIAKMVKEPGILLCGSAGLAEEVPRMIKSSSKEVPILIVSGSMNTRTLNQISKAERELKVRVLKPDVKRLVGGYEKLMEVEEGRLLKEAAEALAEGRDVTLTLTTIRENIMKAIKEASELGYGRLKLADAMLRFLGKVSRSLMERYNFTGLILIGGDTAIRVVRALGAEGVKLEGEVSPGIPMGRLIGGDFNGLRVVTKAGGFGGEEALVDMIRYLKGCEGEG